MTVELAASSAENIAAIAALVGAVGTVAAVLVALYLNWFRAARRRPELSLAMDTLDPPTGYGLGRDVVGPTQTIRLRVTNAQDKDTAHDVEVLLSASWTSRTPDSFTHLFVDHRPLLWSDMLDADNPTTRIAIPPGVSRKVDLLKLGRPWDLLEYMGRREDYPVEGSTDNGNDDDGDDFEPDSCALILAPPWGDTDSLLIGDHLDYAFVLVITARDVNAVYYELPFTLALEFPEGGSDRHRGWISIRANWGELKESTANDSRASLKSESDQLGEAFAARLD